MKHAYSVISKNKTGIEAENQISQVEDPGCRRPGDNSQHQSTPVSLRHPGPDWLPGPVCPTTCGHNVFTIEKRFQKTDALLAHHLKGYCCSYMPSRCEPGNEIQEYLKVCHGFGAAVSELN